MKKEEITKQFIDTNKYYLREVKKGKEKVGLVDIELLQSNDSNIPCYLYLNNSSKIMAHIYVSKEDELSINLIASEIYNLFNINAPLAYYLYNESGNKALISISTQKERDILVTGEEVITNLVEEVKRGIITLPVFLKDYLYIVKNKEVQSEKDIINLIEVSIHSIAKKYNLDDKEKEGLLKKFLEIIILDYITLNTKRNTDSYGFLVDKIKDKVNITLLNSYNRKVSNDYVLNGIKIEYMKLLKSIFNNYYDYIKALVRSIIDNRSVYEKCINLIVDANSSLDNSSKIKEAISTRLDDLLVLDNEIDKSRVSKIDLVLTKTNVNLKVVNKTSEIMQKYQNYEPLVNHEEDNIVINYDESEEKISNVPIYIAILLIIIVVIGMVLILLH